MHDIPAIVHLRGRGVADNARLAHVLMLSLVVSRGITTTMMAAKKGLIPVSPRYAVFCEDRDRPFVDW